MLTTTKAIVLSKIKFGEHDLIVKCYTKEGGLVSYMLRGVLKSKKGKARTAYFQLLSQLQLITTHKSNRSLQSIKEVKIDHFYKSLHTQVLKSTIVMFLAEVLTNSLKEEEQNSALYNYLENTLLWLDLHNDSSNFHLLFLLKLTQFLGFYPDETNSDLFYFNLEEGQFEAKKSNNNSISGENLTLLKQLLGTTFDALITIKINSIQRQSFLNMILLYFELHLGSFKKPKSLQILNQVFS